MDFTITNVGLLVQDVQGVVGFYRKAFNLTVKQDYPEFVEFNSNGATLFLWEWSHLERYLGKEAMAKVKHPFMAAIFCENVTEVDDAYQHLSNLGVDFITPPQDWPWNARAAYFVDPEGYIWELYTWIQ
jgi:uncharacterized glyoxalase superfamily protein PhnB